MESAFDKLSSALAPHMRQFLDQLPRVLASKPDPMRKRDDPRQQAVAARLLEATLHLRQASLTYHSQSSDRTKTYLVHPYRLAHAQGGLYLLSRMWSTAKSARGRPRTHAGSLAARRAVHAD